VLHAAVDKAVKVVLRGEDHLWEELGHLIDHEGCCLANLGDGVIDHTQEALVGLTDNVEEVLGVRPIDDRAEGDHADISISPFLTTDLSLNEVEYMIQNRVAYYSCYVFECVSSR
jgi:hypothetical protein